MHKAMSVTHKRGHGWTIATEHTLTDAEAAAITFRAEPRQVVMGEFVEVADAEGTRIGHVKTAEYVERAFGPAFVTVSIELR
jgi:hypothetical protein